MARLWAWGPGPTQPIEEVYRVVVLRKYLASGTFEIHTLA